MKCSIPSPPGLRKSAWAWTLDDLRELVTAGVLQHPDGDDLVVLAVDLPEVRLPDLDLIRQSPFADQIAQGFHLLGGGVQAGGPGAVVLQGVEQEPAEAAADVDDGIAGGEADLAADVLDLVALGLLQGAGALLPVAAGVHHQGVVEPQAVELGAEAVVEAGVGLGLRQGAVGEAPLVPAVAQAVQGVGTAVETALHAYPEQPVEVALDVQGLVEVGLQHPHVPEQQGAALGPAGAEAQGEDGLFRPGSVLGPVREHHAKADGYPAADVVQALEQG